MGPAIDLTESQTAGILPHSHCKYRDVVALGSTVGEVHDRFSHLSDQGLRIEVTVRRQGLAKALQAEGISGVVEGFYHPVGIAEENEWIRAHLRRPGDELGVLDDTKRKAGLRASQFIGRGAAFPENQRRRMARRRAKPSQTRSMAMAD